MITKSGILLCAGPSLAHYQPRTADLVVAVNRAALLQNCDVGACGDWPLVEEVRDKVAAFQTTGGRPLPALFTAAGGRAEIVRPGRGGEWAEATIQFEDLYDGHEHEIGWTCYTATAAVWLCACRGVQRLDVFGADWGGRTYCDGSTISQNRQDLGAKGWEQELYYWGRVVEASRKKGMEVIRHLPPTPEHPNG